MTRGMAEGARDGIVDSARTAPAAAAPPRDLLRLDDCRDLVHGELDHSAPESGRVFDLHCSHSRGPGRQPQHARVVHHRAHDQRRHHRARPRAPGRLARCALAGGGLCHLGRELPGGALLRLQYLDDVRPLLYLGLLWLRGVRRRSDPHRCAARQLVHREAWTRNVLCDGWRRPWHGLVGRDLGAAGQHHWLADGVVLLRHHDRRRPGAPVRTAHATSAGGRGPLPGWRSGAASSGRRCAGGARACRRGQLHAP